jgi:deferrochelatase/peroxidase EfeB
MIVGRFRDGTPLTKYSSERRDTEKNDIKYSPLKYDDVKYNDFKYEDDSRGSKCPLHAHIRKVRPREDITNHRRRMVRRGVPYGDYNPVAGTDKPERGSGLLFMAFMRNLHSQFGSVQKEWANSADFPEPRTGTDPLIGQSHGRTPPSWPVRWGEEETKAFRFGDYPDEKGNARQEEIKHYVTLQGGAFFFAPSLAFFDSLAQSGAAASSRSVRGGAAQSAPKKSAAKGQKVSAPKSGSRKTAAKSSSPSGGAGKYRT